MALTNKIISQLLAFSEGGQNYLDTLLKRGADDVGLKQFDDPLQQIRYGGNIFQHTGPKGIESYDLGAKRVNASGSPLGIYATLKPRETNMYRGILEDKGIEPETYNLVSSARKAFVIGEDKPTAEMMKKAKDVLAKRDGFDDWSSIPDGPHKGYLEGKLDFFRENGYWSTDITPADQSDIYMAGGADALLRNGNEFVFMKPNQTRDVRAEFDSRRANENNWFASAAPVASGGILAALGGNDANAAYYRPADKSIADLAQRTIRQSYDPSPDVGSIEGVPNNPVSQGANAAAFKVDRLNRNLQNAGILSLLAPESTPDVLGRAAYGESRWYDPALVLLDFL
jgi:hypothetical protein